MKKILHFFTYIKVNISFVILFNRQNESLLRFLLILFNAIIASSHFRDSKQNSRKLSGGQKVVLAQSGHRH